MVEEIAEFFGRGIISILRHFLWEIVAQIIAFNLGRLFLLIITFGKYPKQKHLEKHEGIIMFSGFMVPVFVWAFIAICNNWGTVT